MLCSLYNDCIDIAFTMGAGGFLVAVGIIDFVTRTCAPWSIKALIHFCRHDLHLFETDLKVDEKQDVQILGTPMPAIYPSLMRKFLKKATFEQKKEQIKMLIKYTVFPHCINLLQWMCKRNMPKMLKNYLEEGRTRYLATKYSPLLLSTTRCANALNQYLTDPKNKELL